MAEKFGGIKIKDGRIEHKQGGGPIAGAHATVDTAGEIERRISLTRTVMSVGLGLLWRKKKDRRELFILVEGPG